MKKRFHFFSTLLILILFSLKICAQVSTEIKGKITDDKQVPLDGATIVEKGTQNIVTSKIDGSFTIKIRNTANFSLLVSYVNYSTTEIKFTAKPAGLITVSLKALKSELDDVVVIAYGSTTKRQVSNSIVSISAKQVEDIPVGSPAEAMIGLVAGATIATPTGEPGQNPYIRIRGLGSISAGNNPLFIVDGYPLGNADNFYNISPADIQSIQILKDAAATALYGSRGANGIVSVTTKRGVAGKTKFAANIYHGIANASKKIELLNRDQYVAYIKEAYANSNTTFPAALVDSTQYADTDWQDAIFRTGSQDNFQISASGGSDAAKFYLTGSYFKQNGIIKGTSFDRALLRASFDAKLSSKLKIGITLAPNFSTTYTQPVQGNFNNATFNNGGPSNVGAAVTDALLMAPLFPVRTSNGDYGQQVNSLGGAISLGIFNPVATLDLYKDKMNAFKGIMISFLEYQILKNLTFKTSLGGEALFSRRDYYVPSTLATGSAPSANLSNPLLTGISSAQINSNTYNWVWENTLNYTKIIRSSHKIEALLGYGAQKNTTESSTVTGKSSSYTSNSVQMVTGAGTINGAASYTANALASAFGRVNYSYKLRYILSAAIRTDGSSRFGSDNRYATFPSVSAAWRIADEKFMKKYSSVLSELKLRASYGVTGNNNIGDYNWQSYEQAANYIFGTNTGAINYGFSPNSVAIKNLTWETNKQTDVGLELGLFNNKIYLTVEAYRRTTTNLLLNRNVPSVVGFATRVLNNVGEVRNDGVDVQLQTTNINNKNFKWTTGANIFWAKNKVIALTSASDQILFDPVFGYTSAIRVIPGLPMGSFFGYEQIGVYQNSTDVANSAIWSSGGSKPGDIKYKDVSGANGVPDGVIDANDIHLLGDPYPKFSYGMQNEFTYKNWSFNISIQGIVGGKILNGADRYIYNNYGRANGRSNALNRWRSETDPGDGWTPRVLISAPSSLTSFSSHELFDATFLRIKTVQLRYNLPKTIIDRIKVKSASLYIMAQNLFTFQKYFGYNPEANLYGNSTNPTYGVDQGTYPLSRTINFGANISF